MGDNIYEEVFLEKQMVFIGVDDLFKRLDSIREAYSSLEKGEKRVYKWYFFFQLCVLKRGDDLKSAFWDFIISTDELSDFRMEFAKIEYEKFDFERKNLFKSQR